MASRHRLVDAVTITLPCSRNVALRRARAAAQADRLLAFCHGWVSLEQIGFPFGTEDARRSSFDAAVRALQTAA